MKKYILFYCHILVLAAISGCQSFWYVESKTRYSYEAEDRTVILELFPNGRFQFQFGDQLKMQRSDGVYELRKNHLQLYTTPSEDSLLVEERIVSQLGTQMEFDFSLWENNFKDQRGPFSHVLIRGYRDVSATNLVGEWFAEDGEVIIEKPDEVRYFEFISKGLLKKYTYTLKNTATNKVTARIQFGNENWQHLVFSGERWAIDSLGIYSEINHPNEEYLFILKEE